ncbi:hypothetical protein [Pontibacter arcticus]|uniref:hypothetical protein n=1 Tax=Pontibacter arcticus TaxID=2080288 RepID=UPI0014020A01|nr:hypothetical protein [Pontibacter arcticus]
MKTSNKLLLGMLVAVMLGIVSFIGFAKLHAIESTPGTQKAGDVNIEFQSK